MGFGKLHGKSPASPKRHRGVTILDCDKLQGPDGTFVEKFPQFKGTKLDISFNKQGETGSSHLPDKVLRWLIHAGYVKPTDALAERLGVRRTTKREKRPASRRARKNHWLPDTDAYL